MSKTMNILAVGDVIGRPGRDMLANRLQGLVDQYRIDLVIVNGENAAGGRSITPEIFRDFINMGVDVVTTGNHIWDNNDVLSIIDNEDRLLRPANFPPGVVGKGFCHIDKKGVRITVMNFMGRSQMDPVDCPFRAFDELYNSVKDGSDIIIVDLHAETTSEKRAFGWYTDGRASAVYGTHTHVQTADEEIFPGGTGYITDIGMTGAFDSVIGMNKEQSIRRFLYRTRVRFEVATGNPRLNGIMFTINTDGKTESICRVNI